jgi:uncharacterized protein (DUF427 family)
VPTGRPILVPGPDHPIAIEADPSRVIVTVAGRIVADSRNALTLREASYPPVQYLPRSDVRMEMLRRSEQKSHCPYKGDASYYGIEAGGAKSIDAVWTYEQPHAAVARIKDLLAFYPDRVDEIRVEP